MKEYEFSEEEIWEGWVERRQEPQEESFQPEIEGLEELCF